MIQKQNDRIIEPSFPESEAVLCAAAVSGEPVMAIIRKHIEHHMEFTNVDMRAIYFGICVLYDRGEIIDLQGVVSVLRSTPMQLYTEISHKVRSESRGKGSRGLYNIPNSYKVIDGQNVYSALRLDNAIQLVMETDPSIAVIERHAKLVHEASVKRRVLATLKDIDMGIRSGRFDLSDVLSYISRITTGVIQCTRSTASSAHDIIPSLVAESLAQNNQCMVTTGLRSLDDIMGSLRSGGTYILAARPGVGKTTMALAWAKHMISQHKDIRVLFFSLEISKQDVVRKTIAAWRGWSFKHVLSLSPEEWGSIRESEPGLDRLIIADMMDMSVERIRNTIAEYSSMSPCVAIIDYLQLISHADQRQTEYEAVTWNSRQLKIASMQYNIPIIALSQMSRDIERGKIGCMREPRLSDLRSSGAIEQDANAVVFLHRCTENGAEEDRKRSCHILKVIVAKNRFGPTGHAFVRFDADISSFTCVNHKISNSNISDHANNAARRAFSALLCRSTQDLPDTDAVMEESSGAVAEEDFDALLS